MSQWGFYYNQERCVNCKACTVACKAWNDDKRGDIGTNVSLSWLGTGKYDNPAEYEYLPGSDGRQNYEEYSKYHMKEYWRRVYKMEYGTIPPDVDVLGLSVGCNHCDKPACIEVCPMQIITKEPEYGIVLVDNTNCISCGKCRDACPWDAPQFYDPNFRKYAQEDPLRPKMTKCTFCLDRIRGGLKPACVAACFNRALDAGPIDELKQKYPDWSPTAENAPSDFVPSLGINTGPNIIYRTKMLRVGGAGSLQSDHM
jgi:anaerobic dimethyl sulfoxide reductase subunit B (iron-sulfur subunit)